MFYNAFVISIYNARKHNYMTILLSAYIFLQNMIALFTNKKWHKAKTKRPLVLLILTNGLQLFYLFSHSSFFQESK